MKSTITGSSNSSLTTPGLRLRFQRWSGTTVHPANLLKGYLRLKLARTFGRVSDDRKESPISRSLHENGYYVLENPLPAEVLRATQARYQALLADDATASDQVGGRFFRETTAEKYRDYFPELFAFVDRELAPTLKSYYGAPYVEDYAVAWRTFPIAREIQESREMYSNWWHCDNHTQDTLKLFLLLSDVDITKGPTHVLSRAKTRELMARGFDSRNNYAIDPSAFDDAKKLTGPAGTLYLVSTPHCLHKAGVPIEGNIRDIFHTVYKAGLSSSETRGLATPQRALYKMLLGLLQETNPPGRIFLLDRIVARLRRAFAGK